MKLSRRSVISQLKATRIDQPLNEDVAENMAARLKSLAVSGAQLEEARRGRVGRKVVAVVGSLGIFAWMGVTGVAASVGLVVTGNMPAPIQNAVSTVLDVAGITVPRADDESTPAINEQPNGQDVVDESTITTTTMVDQGDTESQEVVTPIPVETTVPELDEEVDETPTTIAKPVGNKPTSTPNKGQENSNNGDSGNSGNANSGNAGNSGNANSGNAGNSGNSGSANSGNAGNSGNSDNGNSSNANSGNAGNSGNNGQGNGNGEANSETVVTAPAVLAPLMPVNEPPKGNANNQGNSSNKNKGK